MGMGIARKGWGRKGGGGPRSPVAVAVAVAVVVAVVVADVARCQQQQVPGRAWAWAGGVRSAAGDAGNSWRSQTAQRW